MYHSLLSEKISLMQTNHVQGEKISELKDIIGDLKSNQYLQKHRILTKVYLDNMNFHT